VNAAGRRYNAPMPLPFDATLKQLVQAHPLDWLAALHVPADAPVEVLTPDLSTVTRFADTVLRVGDRGLLHLDFQSGPDPALARRLLLYNVLLHEAYGLPVHTAVVLLRPQAGGAGLRGTVSYQMVPRRGRLAFRFEVVRLWQRPVEELLVGGLGLVPLAPLGRLPAGERAPAGLTSVVERLVERVTREATPADAAGLLSAAYILVGLRLPKAQGTELFRGVRAMRESSTYQAILDEGREEGAVREARKLLLRQGEHKFGKPETAVEAAIQAINDLERLERMGIRLFDASVSTWQDFLATR
jgi:predicted transposase YdaD